MNCKRVVFLGCTLLVVILIGTTTTFADPRQWDTQGVALRQGAGIGAYDVAQTVNGYQLVVWCDLRNGSDDIFAQLINLQGTPMWMNEGVPVCEHPGEQVNPTAVYVDDGWIIFWVDHRYGTGINTDPSFGDIYAQKLDFQGNLLWSANDFTGVMVDTTTAWVILRDRLVAAHDNNHGAIVAWSGGTSPSDWPHVMLQHVNGVGNVLWDAPLFAADTMFVNDGSFSGIADEAGNLVLAWNEHHNGNYHPRLAKITPDGIRAWGDGGIWLEGVTRYSPGPTLCVDGTGGTYVAWTTAWPADVYLRRLDSSGNSIWANDVVVCDAAQDQEDVRIAPSRTTLDAVEGCLLVWMDKRDTEVWYGNVYAQKFSAEGTPVWTEDGLVIVAASCVGVEEEIWRSEARVVSDGSGGLVACWRDNLSGAMLSGDLYARRVASDGSLPWGTECTPVFVSPGTQRGILPITTAAGLYVHWINQASASTTQRYQQLDLTTGTALLDPNGIILHDGICSSATEPKTLALSAGRYAVVWVDERTWTNRELYYQIFDENGAVERVFNGEPLAPGFGEEVSHTQWEAQLAPDGSGGFFAVYHDILDGTDRIMMAHVGANGELFTPAVGAVVCADPQYYYPEKPHCLSDGLGGLYVAWHQYTSEFVRVIAMLRLSTSYEALWADPIEFAGPEYADQNIGGLVAGENNSCLLMYLAGTYGEADVYSACIGVDGQSVWTQTVADDECDMARLTVISDGSGGAIAAWEKLQDYGSRVICTQHLSATGQLLWQAGGVPLSPTTANRSDLARDRHGNTYVSWRDYRMDQGDAQIYLQKVNAAGTAVWEPGGRAVMADASSEPEYDMISDAGDGLFIAWTDTRMFRFHIFATHLDSSGAPVDDEYWTDNGGLVSTSWDEQFSPILCLDGLGGAIVTYVDNKGIVEVEEPPQIYAQRLLDAFTSVPRQPEAVPIAYALHQNYPNPFNPSTEIHFDLARAGRVELKVFNVLGQEVATLVDDFRSAGLYHVNWDGRNAAGESVGTGMYVYRIRSGDFTATKKMMLLR